MAKKVALADVLWEAANEHLSLDGWYRYGKSLWSCNAVAKAATGDPDAACRQLPKAVAAFLRSLGCRVGFENYTFGQRNESARQGARYMWLLLAMHVAEDEGIEIEVDA